MISLSKWITRLHLDIRALALRCIQELGHKVRLFQSMMPSLLEQILKTIKYHRNPFSIK
jgi:hypothetical protein